MGGDSLKKGLALSFVTILLLAVCDVHAPTQPADEDFYKIYEAYKGSLCELQKDITKIYIELSQGKNPQAPYEHILQSVERTAITIGKAEAASHDVYDGLQISLRGHLDVLFVLDLTEEKRTDLMNLGLTEEDIARILDSLVYYNDHFYHATMGFSAEQLEWFYSMGLTDDQVSELQATICDHYTKVRTYQELVKHHQSELLYIQILLSLAALQTLAEPDHQERGKGKSELQNAEERLLDAILSVSRDQSSLENVKAFSKQTYKAAEQQIRDGKDQYLVDFFVGLQVHCGAVTALHGNPEFGLAEIRLYESVLSECVRSPERAALSVQDSGQTTSLHVPGDIVPMSGLVGQIKESDETNNVGWIMVLVKASDSTDWGFWQITYNFIVNIGQALLLEGVKEFLTRKIGDSAAIYVTQAGGVILTLILTAPGIGATWIDSIPYDPAGVFTHIIQDKMTIEEIERGARSGKLCERKRYALVLNDPGVIVYTITCAEKVYRSPWGNYFYYMKEVNSEDEWIVEVQDMKYGLGRVVKAHKVGCGDLECFPGEKYTTIYELWELCLQFTLIMNRSQPNAVWI